MVDFVNHVLHAISGGSYILGAVVGLTSAIIVNMWSHILLAMRAKRRAQLEVSRAKTEAEFREVLRRARRKHLAMRFAETEALLRSIEERLRLSETDKQLVHEGLHQRSVRGSERYLRELVGEELKEVA